MKRVLAVVLLSVLYCGEAYSGFIRYSQWTGFSPTDRAIYIAGVIDGLTGIAHGDYSARMAKHFEACIVKAQFTSQDIADNVLGYARGKPELHTKEVPYITVSYLWALCGDMPGNTEIHPKD
jgi:hypothetical protein